MDLMLRISISLFQANHLNLDMDQLKYKTTSYDFLELYKLRPLLLPIYQEVLGSMTISAMWIFSGGK